MSQTFGSTTLGKITNVKTINGNTARYYCYVEIGEGNSALESTPYVASQTDIAVTGQWVYQQIVDGCFEGSIVDMPEGVDVFSGEPLEDMVLNEAKRERNKRLAVTDWTQNADIPQATKDLWVPYRQALRDVPQQAGFPNNIVWPTPPQ